MNRITLAAAAVLCTVATRLEAQNFPDGGFENCWVEYTSQRGDKYWDFREENDKYFLSTLNTLYDLDPEQGVAPLTAFRLDDENVKRGNYSLKLVSNYMTVGNKSIFLPGAAGTIEIVIDAGSEFGGDCILGNAFTHKPTAIKGWKKYMPVGGDFGVIEIQLKKNGNTIGSGKQTMNERDADWVEFSLPVVYTSDAAVMPDTIVIIFSASGDYDFTNIETLMACKGQKNSTLYLDDIEFEYGSGTGIKEMFDPAVKVSVYPNPSKESVNINIAKQTQGTVYIYDYLSRKTGEYTLSGTQIDIDIKDYAAGSYLINVVENGKVITTARFVKE